MIQVREIAGLSGIGPFVDLPYRLYRKEKYWVPPIRRMEMAQFDPASNPALEHAEYKLWVVEKDGRIAGRELIGVVTQGEVRVPFRADRTDAAIPLIGGSEPRNDGAVVGW